MLVNPVLPETNPDQAVQNMKTQTKLYYHLGAAWRSGLHVRLPHS